MNTFNKFILFSLIAGIFSCANATNDDQSRQFSGGSRSHATPLPSKQEYVNRAMSGLKGPIYDQEVIKRTLHGMYSSEISSLIKDINLITGAKLYVHKPSFRLTQKEEKEEEGVDQYLVHGIIQASSTSAGRSCFVSFLLHWLAGEKLDYASLSSLVELGPVFLPTYANKNRVLDCLMHVNALKYCSPQLSVHDRILLVREFKDKQDEFITIKLRLYPIYGDENNQGFILPKPILPIKNNNERHEIVEIFAKHQPPFIDWYVAAELRLIRRGDRETFVTDLCRLMKAHMLYDKDGEIKFIDHELVDTLMSRGFSRISNTNFVTLLLTYLKDERVTIDILKYLKLHCWDRLEAALKQVKAMDPQIPLAERLEKVDFPYGSDFPFGTPRVDLEKALIPFETT